MLVHVLLDGLRGRALAEDGARRDGGVGEGHEEEHEQGDAQGHDRQRDETPADEAQKVVHTLSSLYAFGEQRGPSSSAPGPLERPYAPTLPWGEAFGRGYALTVLQPMKFMPVVPMPSKPSMAMPLGLVAASAQDAVTVWTWMSGYRTQLSAMRS